MLYKYWTGVLYVLYWRVACTGLVCCMYCTGVLHVLDWCVIGGSMVNPIKVQSEYETKCIF